MAPGADCTIGNDATARDASATRSAIARLPSHEIVAPNSTSALAAIAAPSIRRRVRCTRTPPLATEAAPVSASTTSRRNRSRKTHSGTLREVACGAAVGAAVIGAAERKICVASDADDAAAALTFDACWISLTTTGRAPTK